MTTAPARAVGVVVVTYDSATVLPGCLDALAAARPRPPRCVVVDGRSSDDSVAIARAHPAVEQVIDLGSNAGYAAGINAGAAALGPDLDLVVLNPDCRVRPDTIATLGACAAETGAGIVAPRILETDGALHHSIHRDPTIVRAWAGALLGAGITGRHPLLGEEERRSAQYETRHEIDWASGAILMIGEACRAGVGGWDESFFLYSEETDYQLRARDAGFAVVYEPDAVCVHDGGDSGTSPWLWSILAVNRVRCYAKHHGRVATLVFRGAVLAGEAGRAAIGKPKNRAAFAAVLRDRRPDETPTGEAT